MPPLYNPGRTRQSPVTPPPIDAPLFENGQITQVWQSWLYQQFKATQLVQDLAVTQAFEPEAREDLSGAVEEAARVLQDSPSGQFGADVADLETAGALGGSSEGRYTADIEDLRAAQAAATVLDGAALVSEIASLRGLVSSIEVNRPGSEIVHLRGTHANRLALYPAAAYVDCSTFYETDRNVLYVCVSKVWYYVAGVYVDVFANRPVGLVAGDTGFVFYSSDFGVATRWDGAAWVNTPGAIQLDKSPNAVGFGGVGVFGGGGAAPDAMSLCFGDNTGWRWRIGCNIAGVFTNRFIFTDKGVFTAIGAIFPQNTTSGLYSGNGSPETVVTAGVGSLYMQADAAGGCAVWNKETGGGNTGWFLLSSSTTVIDASHGGTGHAAGYTKGDILVAASASVLTPLGVGTDGDIIVADSAQTLGVKWDTPASGETNNYLEDHSGGISLTTTYQATGVSVTLNQDGYWLIIGTFDAFVNTAGGLLEGALEVNASLQTGVAVLFTSNVGDAVRASICRAWIYHNTGGATPVAELYARVGSTGGGGGGTISGTNTNITAVFLHS